VNLCVEKFRVKNHEKNKLKNMNEIQLCLAALQAAEAQLNTDLAASPVNYATVLADITAVQTAATNLATAVAAAQPPIPVPLNIAAAYTALIAAEDQLETDMSAPSFNLATVQNDCVAVQSALTAFASALASPSNP
jgi:hypothetical protein